MAVEVVVATDGEGRAIGVDKLEKGHSAVQTADGHLVVIDGGKQTIAIYAPGSWARVSLNGEAKYSSPR